MDIVVGPQLNCIIVLVVEYKQMSGIRIMREKKGLYNKQKQILNIYKQ